MTMDYIDNDMTLEDFKAWLPRLHDEDEVDFLLQLAEKALNNTEYFALRLYAQNRLRELNGRR